MEDAMEDAMDTDAPASANPEDPNDIRHFLQAVGAVRRLEHKQAEVDPPRPRAKALQRLRDEEEALRELAISPFTACEAQPGDELRFLRPGLDPRILRDLRRGRFRVQDELDLHGMYLREAHEAVVDFLVMARQEGHLCLRIIHGKGLRSRSRGPVLKGSLDYWLRQRDDVLAFCSARPREGGTGAIYVLLRRSAPPRWRG